MDDFTENNLPEDLNDDSIFDNASDVDYAITTEQNDEPATDTEEQVVDDSGSSETEDTIESEEFVSAEPLNLDYFDIEIENLSKPTEATDVKEDIAKEATPVTTPVLDEEEEKQEKSDAVASAISPIAVNEDTVKSVSDKLTAEALVNPMEAYKGENGKYTTTPDAVDLDKDIANFIGDFVGLKPTNEPSELTVVNKNGETVGSVTIDYEAGGKSIIDTFDADGNKLNHFEYATTSNKGSEVNDSLLGTVMSKGASMLGISSDRLSNVPIGERDASGVITIGDKNDTNFKNNTSAIGNEILLRSDGKGTVANAIGNLVSQSLANNGLTQDDVGLMAVGADNGERVSGLETTKTNTVGSNEAAKEEVPVEKTEEPVPVEKAPEPVKEAPVANTEAEREKAAAEEEERKRIEASTEDFYESSMPSEEAESTAPVYESVEETSDTADDIDSEAEPVTTDTEESSFLDFIQTNAAELTATGRAWERLYNAKDSDLANSEVRAEAEDLVTAVGQAWDDVKSAKGAVATVKALGQLAETAKRHIEDLVSRAKSTQPYLYVNLAKALIQDTINGLLLGLGLPTGALNIVGSWFLNKFQGLLKDGNSNGITVNDLKSLADEAGIGYDSSIDDEALNSSNIDFDTFEADKNAGVNKYNQGLKASDINVKYLYKMSPVIRKVKWSK